MRTALDVILSDYLDWAKEATGSVQVNGFYGLVQVLDDDEQLEILAEADEDSEGVELLDAGWYIVRETPLGFIECVDYGSKDEAEEAFSALIYQHRNVEGI